MFFSQPSAVTYLLASLASFIVASLWQGAALVLLTACALRWLPRQSAAWRAALWTGILLLAAFLPLLPLTSGTPGTSHHEAVWHARSAFSTLLLSVWVLAAIVRLAQLVTSAMHLHQVLRRAEPLTLSSSAASVLRSHGRSIRVCTSPDVDRPSIAGFLHPCILLPPGLPDTVSEVELRQILLHEREHLRRHDHWINLLGQICLVFFPLSPALIWVNRQLALERELACDDRVLRVTGARKAYAACLARVAEGSLAHRGLTLAIGMLGARRRNQDLTHRVERILAPPVRSAGFLQGRIAAGAVFAAILGGAVALAYSPELVSFAPVSTTLNTPVSTATNNGVPQPAPARPGPASGQFVAVVDRVSPVLSQVRTAKVNAVLFRPGASLSACKDVLRPLPKAAVYRRAKPLLTTWHASVRATSSTSSQESLAPLRVVPVLLRISLPNGGEVPTWYSAVGFPDAWVVVMI